MRFLPHHSKIKLKFYIIFEKTKKKRAFYQKKFLYFFLHSAKTLERIFGTRKNNFFFIFIC